MILGAANRKSKLCPAREMNPSVSAIYSRVCEYHHEVPNLCWGVECFLGTWLHWMARPVVPMARLGGRRAQECGHFQHPASAIIENQNAAPGGGWWRAAARSSHTWTLVLCVSARIPSSPESSPEVKNFKKKVGRVLCGVAAPAAVQMSSAVCPLTGEPDPAHRRRGSDL